MDEREGAPREGTPDNGVQKPSIPVSRVQPVLDVPGSHEKERTWPQRAEAVCAILLVFITGTYTWYARGQLKLTGQAISQSKTDNANAIIAQQQIAQAALTASQDNFKKSLESSRDQLRLDQRAWVGLATASLEAVEVGKPIYAHVVLFNSGKTIAKRAIVAYHLKFSPQPFKKLPPTTRSNENTSVGVLIPGGRYDSKFGSKANSVDIDKQNVANWYTYIWGEVEYNDIFKERHRTLFCEFRKGIDGDFNQCGFHNDAN